MLPSAEAADELAYKAVIVGFPLLALTLILGAYWENLRMGSLLELGSEGNISAGHLVDLRHLPACTRHSWMAWQASRLVIDTGLAATLFTYYGVSFFVPSLHSYARPM